MISNSYSRNEKPRNKYGPLNPNKLNVTAPITGPQTIPIPDRVSVKLTIQAISEGYSLARTDKLAVAANPKPTPSIILKKQNNPPKANPSNEPKHAVPKDPIIFNQFPINTDLLLPNVDIIFPNIGHVIADAIESSANIKPI